MLYWASRTPFAANAQQDPQLPWSLIGPSLSLQSEVSQRDEILTSSDEETTFSLGIKELSFMNSS